MEHTFNVDGVGRVTDHGHEDDGGHHPGGQSTDACPRSPHVEAVNEDRIDCNIDHVYQKGVEHGHLAVAHGAEQRGSHVVDGHEGIGQGGEQEIDQGVFHHVRLDVAEEEGQNRLPEEQGQGHQRERDGGDDVQKLLSGGAGPVQIPAAQILGHHHRAAGAQGGKDLDQQQVDAIHQGYTGDGGLSGGGDHDGVGHADGHQQKLLDDQGDDEPLELAAGEKRADRL